MGLTIFLHLCDDWSVISAKTIHHYYLRESFYMLLIFEGIVIYMVLLLETIRIKSVLYLMDLIELFPLQVLDHVRVSTIYLFIEYNLPARRAATLDSYTCPFTN